MMGTGTPLVLVSQEHWAKGFLYTEGRRVLDILNAQLSDFLRLRQVTVYRHGDEQQCVAQLDSAAFGKDSLSLVLLTIEKHEAPEKRLVSLVPKKGFPAFVTVPGLEVRGKVHCQGGPDPIMFLTREAGDFFPVTNAVITSTFDDRLQFSATCALVHKSAAGFFLIHSQA